jgi:transcription elongation factor Elf1
MSAKELQEKFYPNFAIKCLKCNSEKVAIRNTLGWSEVSGGWGEITLVCLQCDNRTEIFDNNG